MPINSLKELKPRDFDYWKAQHLLNRAGFGGTPSQVRALANMALSGAVDYIVDYDKITVAAIDPNEFDRDIMRPANAEERAEVMAARRAGDEAKLGQYQRGRMRRA